MKTFCSIPFTSIDTDTSDHYLHCCYATPSDAYPANFNQYYIRNDAVAVVASTTSIDQVWNNEFYKQLRLDMINDVQNPACEFCWKREAMGVSSYRHSAPIPLDRLNPDGSMQTGPERVNLKIGNTCNLKCIMCHPSVSSEHEREVRLWNKNDILAPSHVAMPDEVLDSFVTSFDNTGILNSILPVIDTVHTIQLTGGEPLSSPEVCALLEELVSMDRAKDLIISIVTNLTVNNHRVFDLLDNFKRVDMTVSWDHVDPEKAYFIRYPKNYTRFIKNFNRVMEARYNISISTVLSVFNIFDIPAILSRFNNGKHITVSMNILDVPSYFSIRYLTPEQKSDAVAVINSYIEFHKHDPIFDHGNSKVYKTLASLGNYVADTPADYDSVIEERTRVLAIYDTTRNTHSKSLFPHLY